MKYKRVIPRDLFNEAKLLKSMGRLALLVLDTRLKNYIKIDDSEIESGFDIGQTIDGELFISNLTVRKSKTHEEIELYSLLNSKENYPLVALTAETNVAVFVFDDNGELTKDFKKMVGYV